MLTIASQFLFFLEIILFVTVMLMHLVKKNATLIFLYAIQSLIIAATLFHSAIKEASLLLIAVVVLTFLIKVIVAPYFFWGLIKKRRQQFSASTYLNAPLTLITLALLTTLSYSNFFKPLIALAPNHGNTVLLSVGMMLVSIFLIINRKGILSQMVGLLSLENAIVSFAYVTGLETAAGPQLGILFDILIWVIIATVFASMIYQHFGSLDTSVMQNLKEE